MRNLFVFSIALTAAASFGTVASAAERVDAPGPGYREQLERFAPQSARDPTLTYRVRFGTHWVVFAKPLDHPSLAPAPPHPLSFEPIPLFYNPFSTAVPFSLVPGPRP